MKFLVLSFLLSACAMNPEHESLYDREGVRKVIAAHVNEARACYETQLSKNPKLTGKMTLDWDIVDEGIVKNTKVNSAKSTMHNTAVEMCLVALISSSKFPPPPPRQTVSVTYPFVFKN